jgi:hypothetical protein
VTLQALQEGALRGFYTSLLRGWLGHQMQRLCVCRLLGPSGFAHCSLKQRCSWGVFFGELPSPTALRPYLIELADLTSDRHHVFTGSETFPVTFLLIGQGITHLDSVVGALMIDGGVLTLGRERLPFQVLTVETLQGDGGPVPYFHNNTREGEPTVLTLATLSRPPVLQEPDHLEVELLTPLALKSGNILVRKPREFSFALLLRAVLRRLYDLATFACGYRGAKPDFASLLTLAEAIEQIGAELRWVDFRRFSSRQQNLMDFGGLVGRIGFRGEFAPFLPYLLLGAELHIGRHTSFGFGRFRCSFIEESARESP